MKEALNATTADTEVSAELPDYVRCVVDSHAFEKTPTLRLLLQYLWQHRAEALSEYAIATEALGRPASFDARTDATVRVQISRLRQRLEKFYEAEGQNCERRITIPVGTHQLTVRTGLPLVIHEVQSPPAAPNRELPWRLLCFVLFAIVLLLGTALLIKRSGQQAERAQPMAKFWARFAQNGKRTRLVFPTPVFLSFAARDLDPNGTIMIRDTDVNDFETRRRSPSMRLLEERLGQPKLAQNYTVTSDTFAAVDLARYLDRSGLETTVLSSADSPLTALDRENLIAIGTPGTLRPLETYVDRMSFVLSSHEHSVTIRNPQKGEPQKFEFSLESETRSVWPGVIGLLPGHGGQTKLLILASRHTFALVSFLTSTTGLDQLDRLWRAKGSPEYFEVLVGSEVEGQNSLVRFWPVALHPFRQ
jgi:hypothetical protein